MKTKIAFTAMVTMWLLLASSVAFSQENRVTPNDTILSQSTAKIERVAVDMGRASLLASFTNLNIRDEYHLILFAANGEQIANYWVDGEETAFYIGSLQQGNYFVVLMEGKRVVDRKQILVK
jgi:hypothetical protein